MGSKTSGTTDSNGDRRAGPSATWARDLRVNQYIDAKDTTKQWLEAAVIGMTQHKVHVHFRGWPVKYNEWIPFESPRLAPAYTHVPNWRALNKGDRVQLLTDVSGVKAPVWRNGTVRQVRRGHRDSIVPAQVLVQVDGDRETRWVDAKDDALSAPGTHHVAHTASSRDGDDDDDDDEDGDEDETAQEPETIVLSDDDNRDSATPSSSDTEEDETNKKRQQVRRGMAKRGAQTAMRPLTRSTKTATKSTPPARARRDDSANGRAARKRKQEDANDRTTWRAALAKGVELEVADEKGTQWYDARVCEVRGKRELCVRFRGWPWRYDEWLPRTSRRLAPMGTHLGRWREFTLGQPVQIGFRASAKDEAPSHWAQGVVRKLSRSMQTNTVKRVQIEWTNEDNELEHEWRDADDDLLAPAGVPTFPLPKATGKKMRRDSGGPAFGDRENDDAVSSDDDDNEAADMVADLDATHAETSSTQEILPASLSDMLSSLTPDDIATAIEAQPPVDLLDEAATTPTDATTRQRCQTMRARQQLKQVLVATIDQLKATIDQLKATMVAAVDAVLADGGPRARDDDAIELKDEVDEHDAEDVQAERATKRVRRQPSDDAVAEDGGTGRGGRAAGEISAATSATPLARAHPAEI